MKSPPVFASKVGISNHCKHFPLSAPVGTRPLAKQRAWVKQLVAQLNPYLQKVIMY